ncbi:TPA: helix-turn-helix domain-containing protein [Bacillus wiedmannii]|uniref:helix-turn-helix domain-containing protein n=1 Tax=Bacillus wiedmannii TaxID=1890302 RepID=UPI000BF82A3E|nr:helix-turn-helix transcriptional regulator [Bacillus wiedmannii]PEP54025.1 transcriptional regulator [Bacillus wiedmannii]HDX9652513.1 helix-turn-helix domain-containing protein [Bacillus wiedmannii]
MAIGKELAMARKRKGIIQEELCLEIPVSRESLAKYETEKRRLPKDLRKCITEEIDDPQLFFKMWSEATGYVSIPFFNGEFIDLHPTSMRYLVQQETNEALKQLDTVCWFKPSHVWSESEKEEMKKVIHEMLDATGSMMSLVAVLCDQYEFSMKDIFKYWKVSLRARNYINS